MDFPSPRDEPPRPPSSHPACHRQPRLATGLLICFRMSGLLEPKRERTFSKPFRNKYGDDFVWNRYLTRGNAREGCGAGRIAKGASSKRWRICFGVEVFSPPFIKYSCIRPIAPGSSWQIISALWMNLSATTKSPIFSTCGNGARARCTPNGSANARNAIDVCWASPTTD